MAADIRLNWEWPADRELSDKLVIKVTSIANHESGWFGLKRSPSIVEGVPDPVDLTGEILRGGRALAGQSVSLMLPRLELEGIIEGDIVAIGLLEATTCICLKKLADPDEDLSTWQCASS